MIIIGLGQMLSVFIIIAGAIVFLAGIGAILVYILKPDYFRKKQKKAWDKKHAKKE